MPVADLYVEDTQDLEANQEMIMPGAYPVEKIVDHTLIWNAAVSPDCVVTPADFGSVAERALVVYVHQSIDNSIQVNDYHFRIRSGLMNDISDCN